VPILVLGVRNDHLTPSYYSVELAASIPGAELVILDDGAHIASQIRPREFNDAVRCFIGRHEEVPVAVD
jgi:aminoacrylate hydrolase